MKYLKAAFCLLCALVLASCSVGRVFDSSEAKHSDENSVVKPTPSGYTDGDLKYTVRISDATRLVVMEAERVGGVTRAVVTSPSELEGAVITDDVDGMRVFTEGGKVEFMISEEASAGLGAVFEVVSREAKAEEYSPEGQFVFSVSGYDVGLTLSPDGYPLRAEIIRGDMTRIAEYSFDLP